jgi:serine/threonine-protein kinase
VAALAPGTLVARYRAVEPIGRGSMGVVWAAEDMDHGRSVALKILAEEHRDNVELRARFVREARAASRIDHPNVVQVYTTGEHDGLPFIAMERLVGEDLASRVRARGPFDSRTAARLVGQVAGGLDAAARAGIVHRDVKPANLMLAGDEVVKVMDFGLARELDLGGEPALTGYGVVVGTPDYIAPEQARGDTIDHRADIYALGGTLFFLLVGRAPFRRGNDKEDKFLKVVARHLSEPPPDARAIVPEVDPGLAELCRRMLAKNPDDRPDFAALKEALGAVGKGTGDGQPATGNRQSSIPDPALMIARRRLPVAGLLLFLLIALGVGAAVLVHRTHTRHARPAQTDAGTSLEAPSGMMIVRDARGAPLFFVDRLAVSNRAFAEAYPERRYAPEEADRPVVNVAYDEAVAYARRRGGRLLTTAEWPVALATPGFGPAGWEWVWAGVDDGTPVERPVRNAGEDGRRPRNGAADTTFRVARDLSP